MEKLITYSQCTSEYKRGLYYALGFYTRVVYGRQGCKHHLQILNERRPWWNNQMRSFKCSKCGVKFHMEKNIIKLLITTPMTFETSMVREIIFPHNYVQNYIVNKARWTAMTERM